MLDTALRVSVRKAQYRHCRSKFARPRQPHGLPRRRPHQNPANTHRQRFINPRWLLFDHRQILQQSAGSLWRVSIGIFLDLATSYSSFLLNFLLYHSCSIDNGMPALSNRCFISRDQWRVGDWTSRPDIYTHRGKIQSVALDASSGRPAGCLATWIHGHTFTACRMALLSRR